MYLLSNPSTQHRTTMKAARTLTTVAASAALLCALPTPSEAIEKVDTRNLNTAEDDVSRELMEVVSHSRNYYFVFPSFSSWSVSV